jgi:rhodanese-related sulfurtransferase
LASEKLYRAGYRNMVVLDEGIPGWYRLGYPIEQGPATRPGPRRQATPSS